MPPRSLANRLLQQTRASISFPRQNNHCALELQQDYEHGCSSYIGEQYSSSASEISCSNAKKLNYNSLLENANEFSLVSKNNALSCQKTHNLKYNAPKKTPSNALTQAFPGNNNTYSCKCDKCTSISNTTGEMVDFNEEIFKVLEIFNESLKGFQKFPQILDEHFKKFSEIPDSLSSSLSKLDQIISKLDVLIENKSSKKDSLCPPSSKKGLKKNAKLLDSSSNEIVPETSNSSLSLTLLDYATTATSNSITQQQQQTTSRKLKGESRKKPLIHTTLKASTEKPAIIQQKTLEFEKDLKSNSRDSQPKPPSTSFCEPVSLVQYQEPFIKKPLESVRENTFSTSVACELDTLHSSSTKQSQSQSIQEPIFASQTYNAGSGGSIHSNLYMDAFLNKVNSSIEKATSVIFSKIENIAMEKNLLESSKTPLTLPDSISSSQASQSFCSPSLILDKSTMEPLPGATTQTNITDSFFDNKTLDKSPLTAVNLDSKSQLFEEDDEFFSSSSPDNQFLSFSCSKSQPAASVSTQENSLLNDTNLFSNSSLPEILKCSSLIHELPSLPDKTFKRRRILLPTSLTNAADESSDCWYAYGSSQ